MVNFKLTVGHVAIAVKDMYSNEIIAHLRVTRRNACFVGFYLLFYEEF